jgi:hypothetical protein
MLYVVQRTAEVKQKNYNSYEENSYKDTVFEQTRRVAYWLAKFRNVLRGHSSLSPVQRQMVPVRHLATRVLLGSLSFYLADPIQHN